MTATENSELQNAKKRLEERFCNAGTPTGPKGIVERVFMKKGRLRAKILVEAGYVAYVDVVDVYIR